MCGEYLLIGENGAWKMPSKGLTAESLPIENPKWRWNGVKFNSNVRSMPVPVVLKKKICQKVHAESPSPRTGGTGSKSACSTSQPPPRREVEQGWFLVGNNLLTSPPPIHSIITYQSW